MVKLKLKFSGQDERQFEIEDGERLNVLVDRAIDGIPLGTFKPHDVFRVSVNGLLIEHGFWTTIALKPTDAVIISPNIKDGDAGQIFKVAALIIIGIVASYFLGPEAGAPFWEAVAAELAVAAVTIGAALLLNALIPPPVAKLNDFSGLGGSIENSQMYSINGQSNQVKRYDTVPKVYGQFKMFPAIVAVPYTELAVSKGDPAKTVLGNLIFIARTPGRAGNNIQIIFQNGSTAGNEIVAVVDNSATGGTSTITVTYEGGSSTALQIKTKVDASAAAMNLVNSIGIAGTTSGAHQTFTGTRNLSGGADGGETVQYLYAIYDFGLGTNIVNNLKIGDNSLSTDTYSDFQFNFVDPALPAILEDKYDQGLKRTFQYYKSRREISSFNIVLDSINDENIQTSDANSNGFPQELVLDFVCGKGLFSFSSGGVMGTRSVLMEIEFAPVGSSDWRPYNDLNYVNHHEVVGGSDIGTSFNVSFAPTILNLETTPSGLDTWFSFGFDFNDVEFQDADGNTDFWWWEGYSVVDSYVRPGIKKLHVTNAVYSVGAKVFYGNRLLGIIQSIDTFTFAPQVELTLDRVITQYERDVKAYEWSTGATGGFNFVCSLRIDTTASAAATITGKSTSPVYGSVRFTPKNPGQYQVRVRRAGTFGDYTTQVADSLTWGALTTSYTAGPILTQKRHTFLELKIRATDQLNGNISTLSGEVISVLPTYDLATDTWTRRPTSNPAWIFCDLITGEINKRAIDVGRLHLPSIAEWADFCDAVPTAPPSQTFTHSRFLLNFVLDYQTTLQDLLAQVGGSGQASLNVIDGKYGVLIDRQKTTPIQIFTPRNSRDFSSTRLYGPRPPGVKVTWIDPAADWATAEIDVFDTGADVDDTEGLDALTSFGCTNHEQAWRFGRYMLAQNRLRMETITLLVDFEYLACTRGDYVQIVQDVMEVGGSPARVKTIVGTTVTIDDSLDFGIGISYGYTFRGQDGLFHTSTLTPITPNSFTIAGAHPQVGDLIVVGAVGQLVLDCIVKTISPNDDTSANLVLVEKADPIYTAESTDILPEYSANISVTSLPDVKPPLAITNLAISDSGWQCGNPDGVEYFITLTWDVPLGSVLEQFEIWVNDGTGFRSIASTKIKTYTYGVEHGRLDIQHYFKVVAVSATGKKIGLNDMPGVSIIPRTKDTPPDDLSSLAMSITNQVLQLSWPLLDDCTIFQYVVRYSPDTNAFWESSTPLAAVHKNVSSVAVQARTGIYFVKAVDVEGNESVNAAEGITTIPDLIDINVIDTLNDAPDFNGEFDSVELLGEAVILSESTHGDATSVVYYDEGTYTFSDIFDLGDVFSVRLQSLIRADGYKKGELMHDWVHLHDVAHLNTALHSDWDIALQYRASNTFESMHDWAHLHDIAHINQGAGAGFTDWRDIPTTGDATGRVFQFRAILKSLTPNVTPRLYDATVQVDMPDRQDSFDQLLSSAVAALEIDYDPAFAGPSPSPNVQVSIENAQTGDYWRFDSKTLAGVRIRFYDKNNTQVARTFDLVAKGYGRQHSVTL